MRALLLLLLLLLPVTARAVAETAHDFRFDAIEGGDLPLAAFKGKTVLVVNTASLCGYTPQYRGLQSLSERYRDRGLIVLGVPANDFGGQEPGSDKEIQQFCAVNFAIDFPMTAKVAVTGPAAHPFYRWASGQAGPPRWNFHKYLLDGDGHLIAGFDSAVTPEDGALRAAIERSLDRASAGRLPGGQSPTADKG